MKNSHPPLLAQFVLALLTQPFSLAPSFSGLRSRDLTSSRSFASDAVYSRAMLARAVESWGVVMSGSDPPACESGRSPLPYYLTHLLALPRGVWVVHRVLLYHVQHAIVLVRGRFEGAFA